MAKKRAKQVKLPTMEDASIPALDSAIGDYVEKRDARMAMGKEEQAAQKLLLAMMKENGLTEYNHDSLTATLHVASAVEKVKVKSKKVPKNESEDEDE